MAHLIRTLIGVIAAILLSAPAHAAPERVTVGAYINDIQSVDLRSDSHIVDFYLWFRVKSPALNPTKTAEFMNLVAPDDHTNVSLYDPPKLQPDGSHYMILHHNGAFSSKFPLKNYPFDTQVLTIELEDTQLAQDALQFVPDTEGASINPAIRLSSYEIGKPSLEIRSHAYPTNFGDLTATASPPPPYSRVIIKVPVSRPWISGTIKVLLPVGLILLSAVLALLIRPDHIEARISLGITALLTLVALQFTASAELPEVDYLMLIDKVYLASYVFILAVLGNVVRGSWLIESRSIEATARMDRRIGALLILLYAAILISLILSAVG